MPGGVGAGSGGMTGYGGGLGGAAAPGGGGGGSGGFGPGGAGAGAPGGEDKGGRGERGYGGEGMGGHAHAHAAYGGGGGGGGGRGGEGGIGPAARESNIVKMRGLPFSATSKDILEFFGEYPLADAAVHIITNSIGRLTGEAFVEFGSTDEARAAMGKDRERMGTRYIELYLSSRDEATRIATRASTQR
ncbi:unnamed protein product [Closterium sp. NIES-54]